MAGRDGRRRAARVSVERARRASARTAAPSAGRYAARADTSAAAPRLPAQGPAQLAARYRFDIILIRIFEPTLW